MMQLLKGMIIAMSLVFIGSHSQAEIVSVKTMKDVKVKVEDILKNNKPEDILVAFDIDMTLTQPNHPAVYYPSLIKYIDVYKKVLASLTPEQKDLVLTLLSQEVPQKLVEKETPEIIKALQEKGIKTIALTAVLSGKIKGFNDKITMLRRSQLQKRGIDFTQSFKDLRKAITFHSFKSYAGGHPLFYRGILSTNGEGEVSKGDTLVAFLKHVAPHYANKALKSGYYPKIVILIDDKMKHIESTEVALKNYDPSIQFLGVEYKGAYGYAPQEISQIEFEKFWEDLATQAKKHVE